MSNISLNPYNANLGNLAYEHGLIQQNQTATINPLAVSYLSEHFQYRIQTIEFTKSLIEWSKPLEGSKQELDTIFRNIERSSSGFELLVLPIFEAFQNPTSAWILTFPLTKQKGSLFTAPLLDFM